MRIVVLDGYTVNPGDLSWSEIEKLGNCRIYDRTQPEEVISRAEGAEIVLTNKCPLDQSTIKVLAEKGLRYIGVLATGYNVVDTATAAAHGVVVTNIPAYGADAVAQQTFALLLYLTNQVADYNREVCEGKWSAGPDFCLVGKPITGLAGLNMGLIGLGDIGLQVAKLSHAFGMKLLVHTRTPKETTLPIKYCSLDDLFANADIVSLHCPLTDKTRNLVNASRLQSMKSTALIINTSRGPLIDEVALADALTQGKIAGAGLDVLKTEPPRDGNPLIHAPNAVVTPHVAWAAGSARKNLLEIAVNNVSAYISGAPMNVVNAPVRQDESLMNPPPSPIPKAF